MSKEEKEKLVALSTYLKNNGLSQSKNLMAKFEEGVKPDKVVVKETKQYRISSIEQGISRLGLSFKKAVPKKKAQKNTFIIKDGRDYIMVKSENILLTQYCDHKCQAQFIGSDVFDKTRDFMSIAVEIDKKQEVIEFQEPVFRGMMKLLIGSSENIINKNK